MNIIFEGINGSGKTSIIKRLVELMKENDMEVYSIGETIDNTPLSPTLEKMYQSDTFLRMLLPHNTVLTESLILAADYHYIQECVKDYGGYKIFDRDIFTQLVYQKYFIEKAYGKENEFFKAWEKCITFNMKQIDMVVYVDVPIDTSIKRTVDRDKTFFDEEKVEILEDLEVLLKKYVFHYCKENNIPLIVLDGLIDIEINAEKVLEHIN